MKKIEKMNELLSKLFLTKLWFLFIPFTLVGILFVACFYIVSVPYMLFDFVKNELNNVLKPTENVSGGTQIVKHLFGFMYVEIANIIATCFAVVMAGFYFLAALSFFISSFGRFKTNLFAFHAI